jgi:predicted nucleic acid-binding protein
LKDFLDTSVLVAAFREDHPHHEPSFRRFETAAMNRSCCAFHTIAEFYATMSALPVKPQISPEQALLFVEEVRKRLTPVSLTAEEYHTTIQRSAQNGLIGGRIYDALLLRCAAKSKAQTIYTWNLKHFLLIAPELSGRIRTP